MSKQGVKTMDIKQGSSWFINDVPGASSIFGAGNPKSSLYAGTPVESAVYFPKIDYYRNINTGKKITNYSKERNIEFRMFNFKNMNVNGASGSW